MSAAGDSSCEVGVSVSSAERRVMLPGTLCVPERALGIVIFAHGSGSSRLSPRNQAAADWLATRGCGTLLFDLLTLQEAEDRRNVFDIDLLAQRMRAATELVRETPGGGELPIGYFGASTGAAAALVAAANEGDRIAAVVSRGGRPDLAGESLPRVTSPTLLIVGERDVEVLELNRLAQQQMRCESRIEIVPGASHLFEEPGTLEQAAELAGDWFEAEFGRTDRAATTARTDL